MKKPEVNNFMADMIVQRGKQYLAHTLPFDVPRGKVGDCFDWCLAIAKTNPKYRYVEGKALVNGQWFHHAWLTDENGIYAYDPTWRAERFGKEYILTMVHYIGIEMNTEKIMNFVLGTGYKAVLENYWRNIDLAKECLK